MLSSDENSGLFTFMVGVIVVVMVAIGLSLLVDKRFSFSRGVSELERTVRNDAAELDRLKSMREELTQELVGVEPRRKRLAEQNVAERQKLADLALRRQTLVADRDKLKAAIDGIEEAFADYQRRYREVTWKAAVGESLGTLTAHGGREYRNVVIKQVTDVGLEVTHETGIARLQASDLEPALQDRFQWDDAARLAKLAEERARSQAMMAAAAPVSPKPETTRRSSRPSVQRMDPDAMEVEALREKVRMWNTKVDQLTADWSSAQSASYGNQSSVPGSLETWQARADRLGRQLAKANAALAMAKADLSRVAPNDPLLRARRK